MNKDKSKNNSSLSKRIVSNNRLLIFILLFSFLNIVQGFLLISREYLQIDNPLPSNIVIKDNTDPLFLDEVIDDQADIDDFITASYEEKLKDGIVRYVSPKLKVQFDYLKSVNGITYEVKELGNKIYLHERNQNYLNGQSIEIFEGYGRLNLAKTIEERFLSNSLFKENCRADIVTLNSFYPDSYQMAQITSNDSFNNLNSCPLSYTTFNGISFFLFDSEIIDKYAFVGVGQEDVPANQEFSMSWQDTIRFGF